MKAKLKVFMERGWLEPCTSKWASPAFVVPKKVAGEWRLVVDYRGPNKEKECWGLPCDLSCFSKIPKYDKQLRRIFKGGTKSNPTHNSQTKGLLKDMEISYTFRSQQLASGCFICILA